MRILLVEDDDILLALLNQRLSAEHYAIDVATDGQKGWEYASTYEYDLLILDLVLPQLGGIALCQKLRQAGYTLPILILTSQAASTAKIMGLDAGADDYVVKPFDEAELVARIRALLRRGTMNPLPILTWGDLWLNSSTHEVSYAGELLDLTAKEYALLEMMMRESQHVFSKDEILESLWSSEEFPVDATVRSHMRRLRNKLVAVGAPVDLIATSHGRGYYLKPWSHQATNCLVVASNATVAMTNHGVTARPSPVAARRPETASPEMTFPEMTFPEMTSPDLLAHQQQAQYLALLNQTWQEHRSLCVERVQQIRTAIEQRQANCITPSAQADAYRAAHNLVGTLGTFGLQEAMAIARNLEQELHPDIYPEPSQAQSLQVLSWELLQQIETTASLPTEATSAATSAQARAWRSPPAMRVMLVDDDPILLQTLAKQLQGYGFQVSTLADPAQFWTVFPNVAPDVLILDVQMPPLNGLELCQALRAQPNGQKIPVMFLSVFADAKTQHEAFAAGADDYLCKPMTAQDLSDRIQQRWQRIQACAQG
jgi:DNA-binding response OmpR family regulator/HPt (histidine-containing phosphotransfer) domain-containing protein